MLPFPRFPGRERVAIPLLIRFRLGKDLSTLLQVGAEELEGRRERPAGRDLSLQVLSRCARARSPWLTNAGPDAST